jgi:hypothetical protein
VKSYDTKLQGDVFKLVKEENSTMIKTLPRIFNIFNCLPLWIRKEEEDGKRVKGIKDKLEFKGMCS